MTENVKAVVWAKITQFALFSVANDSMCGGPQSGVKKTAVIDFVPVNDVPTQRLDCAEGGQWNFAWQTLAVEYGGKIIDNPEVYWRSNGASVEEGHVLVNNANLGGDSTTLILPTPLQGARFKHQLFC